MSVTFAIGGGVGRPIFDALRQLLTGADRVSIAVSYVQVSGWQLLREILTVGQLSTLRLICTDQLGITDPAAVRDMMAAGVTVRVFVSPTQVYHPKLFIAHRNAAPDQFMLGSANLSKSALEGGVEIDTSGTDANSSFAQWFDALFADPVRTTPVDAARLALMEKARQARLKSRLVFQRSMSAGGAGQPAAALGAATAVEAAFANLNGEVTPLNFDKAANNVRQLGIIRDALEGRRPLTGKTASEMKLLGFADNGQLTALGLAAANAGGDRAVADIWVAWLKSSTDHQLNSVNPAGRLARARHAFRSFWTLPDEVTAFFINNAQSPKGQTKKTLQTIELLANTGRDLSQLSLADVQTLSTVLDERKELPPQAAEAVRKYLANKGPRGWDVADRRVAVESWRDTP